MQSETRNPVEVEARGAVRILWLDNPPVNALGHALRHGIATALAEAISDPTVGAIALLARGRSFPAGADISEFGKPPMDPMLPELCDQIEASPKPVVAGLHGTALGGGLELALAAHGRVAQSDARLGFPEVLLGILPGAGGTQRLPRLIGAAEALRLMTSGRPITATEAARLGIVDKLAEQDLAETTVTLARHMAGGTVVKTQDRRDGFRDPKAYAIAVAEARKAQAGAPLPAAGRIVDCVEAAQLLPFAQGMAYERAAFADLVQTPEAAALRHMFFSERRAARMVGAKAKPRAVTQVSVLGAGEDAVALSLGLLAAGLDVTLMEGDGAKLADGLETLAVHLAAAMEGGKLSRAQHDAQWSRLQPGLPGEEGDAADMVFLTGEYRLPGAEVPTVSVAAGAPIVTLGRVGEGGQRGLGLVLPPATRNGQLAELLVTHATAPEAIATLLSVLKAMGCTVVQGQGAGLTAALRLALTAALDALEAEHGAGVKASVLGAWGMVQAGPAGGGPRNLSSGRAGEVLAALANAGLRMIGEERALRPSDVDLAMVLGLGFPRWGGGPMFWAGRRGLMVLRDDLNRLAELDPDIWSPAPLLDDLIRHGITLADLDDA